MVARRGNPTAALADLDKETGKEETGSLGHIKGKMVNVVLISMVLINMFLAKRVLINVDVVNATIDREIRSLYRFNKRDPMDKIRIGKVPCLVVRIEIRLNSMDLSHMIKYSMDQHNTGRISMVQGNTGLSNMGLNNTADHSIKDHNNTADHSIKDHNNMAGLNNTDLSRRIN